jgi:hypothetical protein
MYLGWGARHPTVAKASDWFTQPQNMPGAPPNNIYYCYYATQVMHHIGGPGWERWNPRMRDHLIETQDQGQDPEHRDQKGSWAVKDDVWSLYGGRVMMTSLAILTLEVYYRHLPLYRRELGAAKDPAVRDGL